MTVGEEWRKIAGTNYSVSSCGRVRNDKHNRMIKNFLDRYGYEKVCLGAKVIRTVHRLVAISFIPNTENKPQVNHKNGVKTDNRVENLEWVTNSENQRHSYRFLGKKSPHALGTERAKRKVRCVETNTVYQSVREAARKEHCNECSISNCIHGRRKTAGGLHWELA